MPITNRALPCGTRTFRPICSIMVAPPQEVVLRDNNERPEPVVVEAVRCEPSLPLEEVANEIDCTEDDAVDP